MRKAQGKALLCDDHRSIATNADRLENIWMVEWSSELCFAKIIYFRCQKDLINLTAIIPRRPPPLDCAVSGRLFSH